MPNCARTVREPFSSWIWIILRVSTIHMEGDHVLTRFARGLKKAVDSKDIVARLGGDEFVVFSPGHYDK